MVTVIYNYSTVHNTVIFWVDIHFRFLTGITSVWSWPVIFKINKLNSQTRRDKLSCQTTEVWTCSRLPLLFRLWGRWRRGRGVHPRWDLHSSQHRRTQGHSKRSAALPNYLTADELWLGRFSVIKTKRYASLCSGRSERPEVADVRNIPTLRGGLHHWPPPERQEEEVRH